MILEFTSLFLTLNAAGDKMMLIERQNATF